MSAAKRNWFVLIVFVLLIGIGLWYNYSNNNTTGSNGNFAQTVKTAVDPYADWKIYTSTKEPSLSFKYPPTWTAEAGDSGAGASFDALNINSPSGTTVSWSSYISGLGGGCSPSQNVTITDSEAIPGAKGLYFEGDKLNDPLAQSYGVTDTKPALGLTSCPYYATFQSHLDSNRIMSFIAQGPTGATVPSKDAPTVKLILESLKY
jgi:hypothetical protein